MNKVSFFNALVEDLRAEFHHAAAASKDAADYATDEESRAESQWDTQGLEASYLAAGQASQAKHYAEAVEELQSEREDLLKPNDRVSLGALFQIEIGGKEETFFFAGVAGGHEVELDGEKVTVVTPGSPLAVRCLGRRSGESFRLANGTEARVLRVE